MMRTYTETPLIHVSPFGKILTTALVFPEPYSIASSNLAFHQVFRLLGSHPGCSCERVVVEPDEPVLTIETGRSLSEFDVVAFTVPFEFGYRNVVSALKSNHIPVYRHDRNNREPIILMGGIAASANPTVMAPFVDFFLLGEAEAALPSALDLLVDLKKQQVPKRIVLEELAKLPAAYVPSIHGPNPDPIHYARVQDMDCHPPSSAWLTPQTEFDNVFLFEISRGCPCGCRFCMIRLSQKPLRSVSLERVLEEIDQLPTAVADIEGNPTRPRVGLVGAAVASHPQFEEICRRIREKGWGLTASAIEIDKVTDEILNLLAESQKTLTLAPERGLELERFRLGKRIEDSHLLEVAEKAARLGMPRLKLYFVVGLVAPEFYGTNSDRPGASLKLPSWLETLDSSDEEYYRTIFEHETQTIAELVEKIGVAFKPNGRISGSISVTCSPFIPKPHTPWSGWPMATEKGLKQLYRMLQKRLSKIPRVRYHPFSSWEALWQGILSQGGPEVAPLLVQTVERPEATKSLVRQAITEGLVCINERRWQLEPPPWNFVRL